MADKRPTIQLPEFAPDLTSLGTGVTSIITGATPRADGYGPFPSFEAFTEALAAASRGYFYARRSDGSIAVFAGTATDLYLLNNADFTWTRVSKGGVSYSTLPDGDNWQWAQYNDVVLATQINATTVQAYALTSSAAFDDLGGSPPACSNIAVINLFLVLSGLLSNPRRLQWCDLDNITEWTAGVGLADYQDLPDGGSVYGMSGGDAYGVVFQDSSIRSVIYAPGSAVVFEIVRISTQDTLFAKYSIINAGSRTFFCSAQGFKVIDAGGAPKPIGKERVDRTFFADVDVNALQLMIGASDPNATRVYWAYKSNSGDAGLFDKVLCFDWSIGQNGRWSVLPISGQYLASLSKPGITLEGLDAIAPGKFTILGTANNGSGAVRLTLDATVNQYTDLNDESFVVVYGVLGTTEANGTWPITVVDATHIDLVGSTFANAWVSGGNIGGSLEDLPFSLDSISTNALAQLSAFDSSNKLGFFTGPNIEAVLDSAEQDLEGELVFVSAIRPMTDAADVVVSIGHRMSPQEAISFTDEVPIDDQGDAPFELETRYAKARMRVPAGATWTYARGFQPRSGPAGER